MNIEHKLEPIEHWIVDGKAYRLATESDVGKEVYRTDLKDGVLEATHPVCGTVTLAAYEPGHEKPYVCVCRWKFAYIQDDSLLTPPTPIPSTNQIDWTKPMQTKSRHPVRILCTDGPSPEYPVIGIIGSHLSPVHWTIDGRWMDGTCNNLDLENAPQRIQREYWVNVYESHIGGQCKTQAIAKDMRENGCLACVKITIDCEEGEGL